MRHALPLLLCLLVALPGVAQEAQTPQQPEFTFAVIGGCSVYPGSPTIPATRTLFGDMANQRPALVLGTGDYIAGSLDDATLRAQYNTFGYLIAPLQRFGRTPLAFAPGQGEVNRSSRLLSSFSSAFGSTPRSFDYGGCHFVILNTETPGQEGRIDGAQWYWLDRDLLGAREARHIFVLLNRPLFPVDTGVDSSLDSYPKYRDTLHALFVVRGVSAVFEGGERLYNCQRRDGVDYFISAGGGPVSLPGGFNHYLLVTVGDEGYKVTVRKLGS